MLIIDYLKSKQFIRTIITMLLLVVIGLFALYKFLEYTTHHDQKIEVPDLGKMSLVDAERTLTNINLNMVVIDSASFNPDYPPKSVIDHDPEAGDFVKENRKIYVTLNPSSYRKISIPNVLNKTKRQVETQLKSAGFRIGEYYYIPDLGRDVVRKLQVNDKEVNAGDLIPKNTKIDLVLGDGKGEERDDMNTTDSE